MLNFDEAIKAFTSYLQIEKNASPYTVKYYQNDLEIFFAFLQGEGITDLGDVDQKVVRIYLTMLYNKQLSRRSVSRKISTLRSFYKYLERENVLFSNPFVHISLPRTESPVPGFLYKQELEKLFEINDLNEPTGQRNQALIELLYATGMRVSECQGLRLQDIDFSIGTVFVRGKGRKERYIPFGRFAEIALETYITEGRPALLKKAEQQNEAVFLNARGNPITARGIRLILNKMVEKAALTVHVHPHKLRHTFATHLLNEGADLRSVQELLGHENLSSTQIYTHVTKDYLRSVYMNSHPRANNQSND
ncbi:tyrosine recombinase XerC [Oceanobacillus sp. M65]|uniref:Tyrosine recombinase XerC n=1 Tax=Oceanobacillus jordanicus TaxID=2867266 RepID=A0AAW5B4Z8_9BACI|nr:tyrosine recombinase XerC [Oceanobacillus jordanicus]AVQ99036.1 tyrosine recombinase XerC [Oceanobacillus iheyensis]MCG3419105.1 tyrosine recombinase XerC [Oceanobacillus jordanicus]